MLVTIDTKKITWYHSLKDDGNPKDLTDWYVCGVGGVTDDSLTTQIDNGYQSVY